MRCVFKGSSYVCSVLIDLLRLPVEKIYKKKELELDVKINLRCDIPFAPKQKDK